MVDNSSHSGIQRLGTGPLGKLTGLKLQNPVTPDLTKPTILVDNTYAYDHNANRIEKQTLSGMKRFAYDSRHRLVKAEYPTRAAEYRYDKAGNRTAKIWTGADAASHMEEHYHYDPCNRLTAREILNGNSSQGNLSQSEQMQYHYELQDNRGLNLFPRAMSQDDMLACQFGECRESQIPRSFAAQQV